MSESYNTIPGTLAGKAGVIFLFGSTSRGVLFPRLGFLLIQAGWVARILAMHDVLDVSELVWPRQEGRTGTAKIAVFFGRVYAKFWTEGLSRLGYL